MTQSESGAAHSVFVLGLGVGCPFLRRPLDRLRQRVVSATINMAELPRYGCIRLQGWTEPLQPQDGLSAALGSALVTLPFKCCRDTRTIDTREIIA